MMPVCITQEWFSGRGSARRFRRAPRPRRADMCRPETGRALPSAAGVVVRLAWASSRRLTVLAGVVHVASGCATAFGLFATTTVFTALLAAGPTPHRLLASLPAIGLVVASYAVRALLD